MDKFRICYCVDCGKQLNQHACYSKTKRCCACAKTIHGKYRKDTTNLCIDCQTEIAPLTAVKGNCRCHSCAEKNKSPENAPNYKHGKTLIEHYCIECGKLLSNYQHQRCRSCSQGGTGIPYEFANYSSEFNKELKEKIKIRDNYKCQNCEMDEKEHVNKFDRKLHIHHIDYNKENCKEENLITLCIKCNLHANKNRDYWYAYFTYIMENILCVLFGR